MAAEPGAEQLPAATATESTAETPEIYTASQTTLVWRAFRKHKLAMAGAVITVLFYLVAIFAEFLAPFPTGQANQNYPYAPPQRVHVLDRSDGHWDWGLYVYDYKSTMNPHSFKITYHVDKSKKVPLTLFPTSGPSYKLWGLIPMSLHLIGPAHPNQPMYLLGSDSSGRDLLSRLIYGTRVSMSIGLVGVILAFVLGLVLGGISGYFGGKVDTFLQRLVEFFMSIPTLPLWLGLAAAVPGSWGPLTRYFAITVILATFAWTNMARVTRGRFMSLREEEFITSARLDGNRPRRLIFRHMLPSFTSYLIASLTLSIPGMILAETSLSFLGLGLQAPVVSWGVLLQAAQNVRVVATAPWLMLPGLVVVIAVLALNFVGDGLRDAADPYKR
ncbi:MAG TPA: ABC transporter permease [Mycobacteriales bacterium]|nr:ABC transporter permease [Mycobacteriales bacterium]